VSGLFRAPMLAWCFADYVDYAFVAVDSDLVTGVQSYRHVAAADDGGMPNSRATMAACDRGAPTSVTTAVAWGKVGIQPMLVTVVTRMSPSWPASSGSLISPVTPSAAPGAPLSPMTVSSAGAVAARSS
jgi:hypothetical protein